MLMLRAQMREPTQKTATATSSMTLRPKMSLSLPQDGTSDALARR